MLICDRNSRKPVFYDHVANVTTDGLRPIEIVRINPVEGCGTGSASWNCSTATRRSPTCSSTAGTSANPALVAWTLWTPTNTLEGDRDPNLRMNWGGTYTKKAGMKAEDVLETIYLNDIKFEQVHMMIQFFMQLAYNESGVSSANDDSGGRHAVGQARDRNFGGSEERRRTLPTRRGRPSRAAQSRAESRDQRHPRTSTPMRCTSTGGRNPRHRPHHARRGARPSLQRRRSNSPR